MIRFFAKSLALSLLTLGLSACPAPNAPSPEPCCRQQLLYLTQTQPASDQLIQTTFIRLNQSSQAFSQIQIRILTQPPLAIEFKTSLAQLASAPAQYLSNLPLGLIQAEISFLDTAGKILQTQRFSLPADSENARIPMALLLTHTTLSDDLERQKNLHQQLEILERDLSQLKNQSHQLQQEQLSLMGQTGPESLVRRTELQAQLANLAPQIANKTAQKQSFEAQLLELESQLQSQTLDKEQNIVNAQFLNQQVQGMEARIQILNQRKIYLQQQIIALGQDSSTENMGLQLEFEQELTILLQELTPLTLNLEKAIAEVRKLAVENSESQTTALKKQLDQEIQTLETEIAQLEKRKAGLVQHQDPLNEQRLLQTEEEIKVKREILDAKAKQRERLE